MKNMNSTGGSGSGIDQLLIAAQSLGDHPAHQLHPERNNFHGYARSPPEKAYDQVGREDLALERKREDRIRFEPKERQRPGGRFEHNRLEKDRRAQLKLNFNMLKEVVPHLKDKKTSNQAILRGSQKCIQSLLQQAKRIEQDTQRLAAERGRLNTALEKAKEKFEQEHGFPAHRYLESLNAMDVDDQASDTTLSATECPDNYMDFQDEDTLFRASEPRCIPHPVIKPVPHSHGSLRQPVNPEGPQVQVGQRDLVLSSTAATANTVKKLHAKLTSTKQPQAVQGGAAANPTATSPRPVTVTGPQQSVATAVSINNRVVRPRLITTSPVVPVAVAAGAVTLPPPPQAQAPRGVGQSLLPARPHTSFVPTLFHSATSGSGPGVLVPATIQASPGHMVATTTHTQRLNGQVSTILPHPLPMKEMRGYVPQHHVLLATGGNQGPFFMMANSLPPANNKPAAVSSHGML